MPAGANLKPYHFKKGQSGNPNGSRDYAHRRRSVKEVSSECLIRIASTLFDGDMQSLKDLSNDATVTPIEKLCIGVVIKAFERGDAQALGLLLDRFVGKITERVEVTASKKEETLVSLTDDELAARMARLEEADK